MSSFSAKQRKLKGKSRSTKATKKRRTSSSRAMTYVPAARSPQEKRYIDKIIGSNFVTVGTTDPWIPLNTGSQLIQKTGYVFATFNNMPGLNSGQGSRTGNKCTVTNLNAQGEFTVVPASGQPDSTDAAVRMIWFIDHECNGIAATLADILQPLCSDDAQSAASFNMFSYRNYNIANRFTILKDKTYNVSCRTAEGRYQVPWKFSRRLNTEIRYIDDSANLTAIKGNNIGVLFITNSQTASGGIANTGDVYVQGVCRTKYVG